MADSIEQSGSLELMQRLGLDDDVIAHRKMIAGLEPADFARIGEIRSLVVRRLDAHIAAFFDHLSGLTEAAPLLKSTALLAKPKRLKRQHLLAMVAGDYGARYVEQRIELGLIYAGAGLDARVFLGAFYCMLRSIGTSVMSEFEHAPSIGFQYVMSLEKVAYFDIGLIVDVLVHERERLIRHQQEAIRSLSTPVLQLRERLLLLPIIGVIDTFRARLITDNLLKAIRSSRARMVVMDITGVPSIDSTGANHILQTVTAARLMGTEVIVTGGSAEVAQSLIALGVEVGRLTTVGDLQGGIEQAEESLGYRVCRSRATAGM